MGKTIVIHFKSGLVLEFDHWCIPAPFHEGMRYKDSRSFSFISTNHQAQDIVINFVDVDYVEEVADGATPTRSYAGVLASARDITEPTTTRRAEAPDVTPTSKEEIEDAR